MYPLSALWQLWRRLRPPWSSLPWDWLFGVGLAGARPAGGRGASGHHDQLHGSAPYAAWEAELTAYARLRTGSAVVKVGFAIGTGTGWSEDISLARPLSRDPRVAFAAAELELEHLLCHYRHGWREAVLTWAAWSSPGEAITLPWPPWDAVELPAAVVRLAVAEAVPALALPREVEAWPLRQRQAAAWIAAAWADGCHRALEVDERPGLTERLTVPPAPTAGGRHRPGRQSAWSTVLYHLALGSGALSEPDLEASAGADVREAVAVLRRVTADDVAGQVRAVLAVVQALQRRSAIPAVPQQRPQWLRREWGPWRRAPALRAALDHLARSPGSAAIAMATSAGRVHAAVPIGGAGRGTDGGPGRRGAGGAEGAHAATTGLRGDEPALEGAAGWGPEVQQQLPHPGPAGAGGETPEREGQGSGGRPGSGSGPGVLGGLHVISPTANDRAAYWQLRGALAPEIERLIERLQAAGDRYYASAPRRYQRAGRIDRNRLPAAVAGREAVFTRFVHEPAPAHALCLLLDCSASMAPRAEQLREAAILVESAATAVGARVNAFAFGANWERMEPPAEGAPLVSLGRELHPHGGTPFGPAVAGAAEWLARQPFEEKRLWIFSDGLWSARDRADTAWRPELLRDVVVWVFAESSPEPPTPRMRIVAAPTLADLIRQAPAFFWGAGKDSRLPERVSGAEWRAGSHLSP
ncbi:MAG: hypothetical protein M3442_04805 [Chloroflexota bacterium]|nr:hypothetical protein [Chloroflexota bacterium]